VCDADPQFRGVIAGQVVPCPSTDRRGLDTLRSHGIRTVSLVNLQRGAIVSEIEPTTEYPPISCEFDTEFVAPGPMSRPLANYLAMCAPRASRRSRASCFPVHGDLVLAGTASVN
jgi:hypothetical protein